MGHGGIDSVDYPRRVDALGGLRMKEICAGGWHSCAVSDCGDLYVWGWNQSGQLALPCRPISTTSTEEEEDYVSVECLPRLLDSVAPFSDDDVVVTSLGCGARHTAATLSKLTIGQFQFSGSSSYLGIFKPIFGDFSGF